MFTSWKIFRASNVASLILFSVLIFISYKIHASDVEGDIISDVTKTGSEEFDSTDSSKLSPKKKIKDDQETPTNAKVVILPENSNTDPNNKDGVKIGSEDEELFIMDEFSVSAEQDQGYHSAHTLSGSRTNALIKDTPISISVVNEELISDLNLVELGDISFVTASASAESSAAFGSRIAEQGITFRGLSSGTQLFDFFKRYTPMNAYNRDRIEIARGTNTMVFGHAEPGGKANIHPKKANFANDKKIYEVKGGNRELTLRLDYNEEINEKLAARVMAIHSMRGAQDPYAEKGFKGVTTALTFRPTRNTSIRLHLERVNRNNTNPITFMKNSTNLYGRSGIPDNIPFTKDVVGFLPDQMLNDIFTYGQGQVTVGGIARDKRIINKNNGNTIGVKGLANSLYGKIKTRAELSQLMDTGSNANNMGRYYGPDSYIKNNAYFISTSIEHMFTDNLSGRLAFMHEKSDENTLHHSATTLARYTKTLVPNPNSIKEISQLHFAATWNRNSFFDRTSALRGLLSWEVELGKSKHQLLLGLDADYHHRKEKRLRQMFANGELDNAGRPIYYRYGDYGTPFTSDYMQVRHDISGYKGIRYNDTADIDLFGSSISAGNLIASLDPGRYDTLVTRINDENEWGPAGEYQMKFLNGNRMYDENGSALSLRLNSEGISELQNAEGEPILGKDGNPITYQHDDVVNTQWALQYDDMATQRKIATWLAAQSKFFDGRLNTLLGVRFDYTDSETEVKRFNGANDTYENSTYRQKPVYRSASPTVGAVLWLNHNVGVFGSWSKSINPPSASRTDPVGNTLPPEVGEGIEGGVRFEFLDGKINGEMVAYHIKKENQRVSTGLTQNAKTKLYPYSQYPEFYIVDADGNKTFDGLPSAVIPGATLRSRGAEMRLNYNPTKALSLNFNYSNNVVDNYKMPLGITEGDLRGGSSRHNATITTRYRFLDGALKGGFIGFNQIYRSSPLLGTIYMDIGDSERNKLGDLDGVADYLPIEGAEPVKYQVWLDEQWETNLFLGWSGQFKKGRGNPRFRCQFNVRNLFNTQQLTRNGRYLEGRSYVLTANLVF